MYTLLLLVAPLILLMLSIGEWYGCSSRRGCCGWPTRSTPSRPAVPWYIRHGENFPIAAWQVLFVTGHVLGFYREALTAWLTALPPLAGGAGCAGRCRHARR